MEAYQTLSSTKAYQGKIFDVNRDAISLPNGKEATREVVIHCDGAAVVPVDSQGNLLFVRQYRHPAKAMMLEIPAGTVEEGEAPLECVQRELEEETGMIGGRFTHAISMYPTIGYCSEMLHIYIAEELTPGQQNLDEDEFVSIEKYSLQEALAMIHNGDIIDSKTIVGVLYYSEYKARHQS